MSSIYLVNRARCVSLICSNLMEPRILGSTLELMLLAMVQRGIPTSYELLTKAGLSVGATSRTLKRLESDGLVKSTSGPRTSQRFALTPKGERYLKQHWEFIEKKAPPISFESALRILYLCWLFGQPNIASIQAKRAVEELRFRAKQQDAHADGIRDRFEFLWQPGNESESESSVSVLGSVYRWLKTTTDATVLRAQADALEKAAGEMEKVIPASRLRGESAQKPLF
jgi:DNA-binding PadR family transcriptional regulator